MPFELCVFLFAFFPSKNLASSKNISLCSISGRLEADCRFGLGLPFLSPPTQQGSPAGLEEWVWLEELVLHRCAAFGRMGVVSGTGVLDSRSHKNLDPVLQRFLVSASGVHPGH